MNKREIARNYADYCNDRRLPGEARVTYLDATRHLDRILEFMELNLTEGEDFNLAGYFRIFAKKKFARTYITGREKKRVRVPDTMRPQCKFYKALCEAIAASPVRD